MRQEIALAQAEVTQKGKLAGKGAGMLAGAAVAGLLALGTLTALLIVVLDSSMRCGSPRRSCWLWAIVALVLATCRPGRAEAGHAAGPRPSKP